MIQSASLISSKSSSKFPAWILSKRDFSTNQGGSDFLIKSIARSDISLGLSLPFKSNKTTLRLELAMWLLIPCPITPAPITTILLKLLISIENG